MHDDGRRSTAHPTASDAPQGIRGAAASNVDAAAGDSARPRVWAQGCGSLGAQGRVLRTERRTGRTQGRSLFPERGSRGAESRSFRSQRCSVCAKRCSVCAKRCACDAGRSVVVHVDDPIAAFFFDGHESRIENAAQSRSCECRAELRAKSQRSA